MKGALSNEVGQSLQLILLSAVTTAAYLGLGLLVVRFQG